MTAIDQQILTCYEDLNMSLEDISKDSGFDIVAIKSSLLQNSRKYRASISDDSQTEDDITDGEFKDIRRVLKQIAISSEDDHLRARVGMFLWDKKREKHGNIKPINVSINLINQQLKEKRAKLLVSEANNELSTGGTYAKE